MSPQAYRSLKRERQKRAAEKLRQQAALTESEQDVAGAIQLPAAAVICTEDDLRHYIKSAFGAEIPNIQVCPNHTTPWRAFADAYFANHDVTIWKASRGLGGKSYLLALLGVTEASTLKVDVNVLGGSGEQSERVQASMQKFWQFPNAPIHTLLTDPTQRRIRLVYGNTITALMASTKSVRGPHPARLRMDEIDEMKKNVFEAALGQPMFQNGVPPQLTLSSTHHYTDGVMTYALKLAAEKGWPIAEWCFRETMANGTGWLTQAEYEIKRRNIPDSIWNVEYELQEPSPEARAIDQDSIRLMFDRALGFAEGLQGEIIFEPYQNGAVYVHGADWARKVDFTVIITFRIDVIPWRVVAYYRNRRLSWPKMVSVFEARRKAYNGGRANHDTTGIGDVVDGYISDRTDLIGTVMVGRARSDMLTEYIAGIENGEVISPMIQLMEAEHRLASNDDVWGDGHLPDTISAGSLAYRAAKLSAMATSGDMMDLGKVDDYENPWG